MTTADRTPDRRRPSGQSADHWVGEATAAQLERLIRSRFDRPALVAYVHERYEERERCKERDRCKEREWGGELSEEQVHALRYAFLRRLADDTGNRPLWEGILERSPGLDRDRVVFDLWKRLEGAGEYVERAYAPMAYHRQYFFDWLQSRYHLTLARRILSPQRWVGQIHWLLLAALVALAVVFSWPGVSLGPLRLGAVACLGLAVATQWWVFGRDRRALLDAVQSLLPRLAATVVVGFVVLASSEELATYVVAEAGWFAVPVTLLVAVGYLGLQMSDRVHPPLAVRPLLARGLAVLATAAAHALAAALVGLPVILGHAGIPLAGAGGRELGATAVFVFALGLLLNAIWAEEPLTEPL